MKKKLLLLSLLPLLLTSCSLFDFNGKGSSSPSGNPSKPSSVIGSTDSSISNITGSNPGTTEGSATSSSSEEEEKPDASSSYHDVTDKDFLKVFDSKTKITISLSFSNAALSALSSLQSNGGKYSDAYFPATVTIVMDDQIYTYEEAGVRMKGNTSRRTIVDGDNKIYATCHLKVSLKATFDDSTYDDENLVAFKKTWTDADARKARKKRNFFGLEKFDLKYTPRNNDSCILREVYSYDVFRKQGIPAPYATMCKATVSNETSSLEGTYEFIEPIDKEFLKKRYDKVDKDGDLYKCVYNSMGKADLSRDGAIEKDENSADYGKRIAKGKIGVEDNYNNYTPIYQLKTNDDGENSDFSSMQNYISGIWNVTYKEKGKDELEKLLDVSEFLNFSAVSYLLGNFDDQRYNYNNYYVFFVPSTGKATYIPYDWDWCLGLDGGHSNLTTLDPFSTWTLDGQKAANVYYCTFFKEDRDGQKLGYDRTSYQNEYLQYIKNGMDSVLDSDLYSSLITDYGVSNSEYESVSSYMTNKKTSLANI